MRYLGGFPTVIGRAFYALVPSIERDIKPPYYAYNLTLNRHFLIARLVR